MIEEIIFNLLLITFGFSSILVFIVLIFVSAPYGKLIRDDWGPTLNNKLGWFFMELPTIVIYPILFFLGNKTTQLLSIVFLIIWLSHYIHRTLIFPFLIRGKNTMPILIMVFGMLFNAINTYLQARWINTFSSGYSILWIISPNFLIGIIIFFSGYVINLYSDYIIRNLRNPGERTYRIPRGGLYRLVSCPNYLGEIIEWGGWALMTWSLPGLIFFIWTFANLAPRAKSTHEWYESRFMEYPKERKVLIPYIF
ncbi:MAG: DUF1295 domain-containing protein [Candidatus Lokiarchaeota archaeon]|nr:DUF1295 domain-containing protein [Candidatus Lokiarchaeota archaeon]MBD3202603.1 DUF1295 domain-containing protein [Candidatus Lokiarchaeota archaeon]